MWPRRNVDLKRSEGRTRSRASFRAEFDENSATDATWRGVPPNAEPRRRIVPNVIHLLSFPPRNATSRVRHFLSA